MASTILDPIATALVTVAETVSGLNGCKWVLRDTDSRPAAVVMPPSIERTPLDVSEDHLGQNDWNSEWSVDLYFDTTNLEYGQVQAVEMVEAWIVAVDADQDLGGVVQEAKVTSVAEPDFVEDANRPYLIYPTTVSVLDFVSPSP